jgi:hypothetical protein
MALTAIPITGIIKGSMGMAAITLTTVRGVGITTIPSHRITSGDDLTSIHARAVPIIPVTAAVPAGLISIPGRLMTEALPNTGPIPRCGVQ